jgi:hypothetical protein
MKNTIEHIKELKYTWYKNVVPDGKNDTFAIKVVSREPRTLKLNFKMILYQEIFKKQEYRTLITLSRS